MINIEGRELYVQYFIKYTIITGLHPDTYELIFILTWYCARHGWTLECDSRMGDLHVHSKSQHYIKLELVQSFCFIKWQEVSQMFVMVDYEREMTAKKSSVSMVNTSCLSIRSSCSDVMVFYDRKQDNCSLLLMWCRTVVPSRTGLCVFLETFVGGSVQLST